MANITKTALGFIFNKSSYSFESFIPEEGQEPVNSLELNDTQMLVGTDKGVLFFDTSVSINESIYENSTLWLSALFSE